LGYVPMPQLEVGMYLLDVLFRVGPVRNETALTEGDLEPWERRRGIELAPWQADLILDLSKAYFTEMHAARNRNALCPWATGRGMWKYVTEHIGDFLAALDRPVKEKNGNRQRHRNPPAR
jgi:hypothetical protein